MPKNQETVNTALFNGSPETLILVKASTSIMIHWGVGTKSYETFLQPFLASNTVRGQMLCTQGVPDILFSWSNRPTRFAAAKIFDKEDVPINELFGTYRHMKRVGARGDSLQSKSLLKHTVANFFIAQLQLAAEMCLGRNYPIIQSMEKLYPYDLLVSILRLQVSEDLSSAAAYLLLYLYVDREPQLEVPLPRLTRTITEVAKLNSKELVGVEQSRKAQFALVQVIISDHLVSIRNLPLALHTTNIVRLLHSLVKFNFYGSIDKMKDTIESLMKCLRRGDFDLKNDADVANISLSVRRLAMQSKTTASRRISDRTLALEKLPASQNESSQDSLLNDNSGQNLSDIASLTPKPVSKHSFRENLAVHVLEALESLDAQYVMIGFLVITIAISIFIKVESIGYETELLYEVAVFSIFVIELAFHIIFHTIVRKSFISFFLDFHHALDLVAICLYVIAFSGVQALAIFANLGRATRLLTHWHRRTAFVVLDNANASKKNNQSTWVVPDRYLKTSEMSLETLVQIVHVLSTIQSNVEDWRLSLALGKFAKWTQDSDSAKERERVSNVFEEVIKESAELCVVNGDDGDDILIDLLMYHYPPLVQAALELLMAHHSSAGLFLANLNKLQLITSDTGEAKYIKLERIVDSLKRDADTHEIWGKLETPEHRNISNEMRRNLVDLINECKKTRDVLEFDEKYEPVSFIQNILRNLGCFATCMKIAQLVLLIDKEETFKEYNLNTRNLALTANRLLYWFALDNPINQTLAYEELKFFIKTIDHKIDSHAVISSILRNNIELMESVPKKYIEEFVEMICSSGRSPQYLSLMASIVNVGRKNVLANQYAVIKLISSPENVKKIVHFFVPTFHPDYAKKIRLMSHYMTAVDVAADDLPSDLTYHLDLLDLLSCCTIGRSGTTTIEAKVQSMFNFVDIVDAFLDPHCLLLAKIRLGMLLYNSVLDVETPLPAVKDADCIWKLIVASQDVFTFAKDDLRSIEKDGWESPKSCRQKIEFVLVNAMILKSYFTYYYDQTIFKPEAGQAAPGIERTQLKEHQAHAIIKSLFAKIEGLYEMLSPLLAPDHHKILHATLVALNNALKEKIVTAVENIHEEVLLAAKDYAHDATRFSTKTFEEFLKRINHDQNVVDIIDRQIQGFISKIERLPWNSTNTMPSSGGKLGDVHFEPLIERMVHHVRGSLQIVLHGEDTIKFIDPSATEACIWVLRIFRTMLENRWGMSIYERDGEGSEEQDEAGAELMRVYNDSQMSEMCLDLIAKGIDLALQSEALKLLVAMLFKEGGSLVIQKSIHSHLSQPGSDIFFRTVRHTLHNLMSWHKWKGVIILEDGADAELPDEFILVRCLQLMCEGHYRNNQDIMREQPNNNSTVNLLDDFVFYLQALDNIQCHTSTTAALSICATILEAIQGPCEGNQEYFALNTELVETLNRIIRQRPVHDCNEMQELELKKAAIDIFQALLEGQARKTAVYERILSVIHVDVILVLCRGSETERIAIGKVKEESEESVKLRTESLVLMQMLTDFRPSLKNELNIDEDVSKLTGDSVACIELVWRGELQRRFFYIPKICSALAKSTKDSFVLNVKRASPEDKLYGLLEASKEMYREILHQQVLKSYHLDNVFCRTNLDRVIWLNFYVVCCINILFIVYLGTEDAACSKSDDFVLEYTGQDRSCTSVVIGNQSVKLAILLLNVALIYGAAFALLSSLLVRAPVHYQAHKEKRFHWANCLLYTALEFSSIYYFAYLGMAVMGLVYHPLLAFLLLDFITMSPTSQGVLQAVFKPRRQILMTVILTCIIVYIFAVYSVRILSAHMSPALRAHCMLRALLVLLHRWIQQLRERRRHGHLGQLLPLLAALGLAVLLWSELHGPHHRRRAHP